MVVARRQVADQVAEFDCLCLDAMEAWTKQLREYHFTTRQCHDSTPPLPSNPGAVSRSVSVLSLSIRHPNNVASETNNTIY
jgi:hypothetical protein